jgi:hypothetical protein
VIGDATNASGHGPFAYSVIIEWENVHRAGSPRAREMLRRLASEMVPLEARSMSGEVIIVCDADAAADELDRLVAETFPAGASVRVIEVRDEPYYEKKNSGAREATGSVLVFLDSDVIPEDQWLESLLGSFERSGVDVVAGSTYIEPRSFYSKAFSLFWFFPLRSEEGGLVPADVLFGNNIAFRRSLFLAHPFPQVDQFRGQCGMLIEELRRNGAGIFLQRGSRCAHPPPNGLAHFLRRAICDGHDNVVICRRVTGSKRIAWRQTYWAAAVWSRRFSRGIWSRYRDVGLTPFGAVGATMVAMAYVGCMVAGDVLTRMSPSIVRRHFSI